MIDQAINLIRSTPLEEMDEQFILKLGLNNEILHEQPPEYSEYFGKGLHIWQYPNQISPFIKHIGNEYVTTYLEIGAHKGGTFILMSEILAKVNPHILCVTCDIVPMSSILQEYRKYRNFVYLQYDSTSREFHSFCTDNYIDFAFIDGEHIHYWIDNDYKLFSNKPETKHIVFHDITNMSCPDVSQYWNDVKKDTKYVKSEFTGQYNSVDNGPYLGIGYLRKKD